ncbi:galactokinase [Malassezia cuniculi]|uniref:Galactokinase n=1 Tax=Malassezia cuniculi TaxID=948313 RepID=A0AAF0ESJ1_9BASI|nr:galactokinase [Malassezia cuniculi]
MTDTIPVLETADQVYPKDAVQRESARWAHLQEQFSRIYNTPAQFIARAPGRVNLIGEHVDFAGYSVFPAAIDKDVLMATAVTKGTPGELFVELHNTTERFGTASFRCTSTNPELIHQGPTRWANYFKAALIGLRKRLGQDAGHGLEIRILVSGTVPPESSLSSSAAMTICSSLVIIEALGLREHVSRTDMTNAAIESERLAVSVFGVPDHAIFVSFVPELATTPIRLPDVDEPHVFVISNTLVTSDKKVNGPVQYNLRVVETRLAAAVLAAALGVDGKPSHLRQIYHNTLRAVADSYWDANPGMLETLAAKDGALAEIRSSLGEGAAQLHAMTAIAAQHIPAGGLDRSTLEQLTNIRGSDFDAEFLAAFPVRADKFYLQDRALHVFQEALRVVQFKQACVTPTDDVYERLGALMNASHESLNTLYDCSCAELNDAVAIARRYGSLGSRLTGAGWGGCCVHLVPASKARSMMDGLRSEYYTRFPTLSEEQLNNSLFSTQPARGACIVFQMSMGL